MVGHKFAADFVIETHLNTEKKVAIKYFAQGYKHLDFLFKLSMNHYMKFLCN